MKAAELFKAGQLREAIDTALTDVKKHPADSARRSLLCQLLWFAGEWERSEKQLSLLGQQKPEMLATVSLYRGLLRGELARQEVFEKGRLPEFEDTPTEVLQLHLKALLALRDRNEAEAIDLVNQAEEQRPSVRGTCDGHAFEGFRDLNDLTASFFEIITSRGNYYWIPIEQVQQLQFQKPAQPQDLVWRPVRIVMHNGVESDVYLPALYASSYSQQDDLLRLGRRTDWICSEGPVRGVGQRMFLVGETDRAVLDMEQLVFEPATA